jgi:acetyltransferase-like isoleucine patch superfamily enzyme
MSLQQFKLKIKRAETPFYRLLRRVLLGALRSNLPCPQFLGPALRVMYEAHFLILVIFARLRIFLYYEPLFRSRCASVGRNLTLYNALPYVDGHVAIHIGDDVIITGSLYIATGRFIDHPELRIGNRARIGAGSTISVNQSVVIEDDAIVGPNCRIADNDGHPKQSDLRARNAPLGPRDIKPILIRRHAWIGNGSQIMKGVTIGEGAIIGANSVVISNIPDYCMAMGNPAEVLFRNVGRPKESAPDAETPSATGSARH